MVTAIQAKVAAQRLSDPSVQRALANRAKAGIKSTAGLGIDSSKITSVSSALKASVAVSSAAQPIAIAAKILNTGETMGAGSTYDKIDAMLGGLLPGGVSPTPQATSTALKLAGATAGAALAYGAYTAADKYLFDGKLPLGSQAMKRKKVKHYNYTNMKALKRADKRIDGFIKLSRKVVNSVGYKIVRKG